MPGYKINRDNPSAKNATKLYFFDSKNNVVTTPFEKPMNAIQFNRNSSGTQRLVGKSKLFLDIDYSLYLMDKEELIWKFDKKVGNKNKSFFRWSTYFTNQEMNLDWINKAKCK